MLCIIMRGAPGSGKSTWVKTHYPDAPVCSADHYLLENGKYVWSPGKLPVAHANCFDRFKMLVDDKEPVVIVDNTNLISQWFNHYQEYAAHRGYTVVQKVMTGHYDNVHGVDHAKVVEMRKKLQQNLQAHITNWEETEYAV